MPRVRQTLSARSCRPRRGPHRPRALSFSVQPCCTAAAFPLGSPSPGPSSAAATAAASRRRAGQPMADGAASGELRGAAAAAATPPPALRVFALSDVHTDYKENMAWIEALSTTAYVRDVLLLAGDVSDDLAVLERTLALLTARFAHVFFVPGNHDLSKLAAVMALCARLGVRTRPTLLQSDENAGDGATDAAAVWVVPLLSWHHASFDPEPPLGWLDVPPVWKVMADFSACYWPPPLDDRGDSVAEALDAMNDGPMAEAAGRGLRPPATTGWGDGTGGGAAAGGGPLVLSFSHFLPRHELCPEKRFLFYPELPRAVGSSFLGRRVAALRPHAHVYGHTHFGGDTVLPPPGGGPGPGATRYLQAALAYPQERASRQGTLSLAPPQQPPPPPDGGDGDDGRGGGGRAAAPFPAAGGPLLVLDTAGGGRWAPKYAARWSAYYEAHARDPASRELPSWTRGRWPERAAPAAAAGAAGAGV